MFYIRQPVKDIWFNSIAQGKRYVLKLVSYMKKYDTTDKLKEHGSVWHISTICIPAVSHWIMYRRFFMQWSLIKRLKYLN